MLGLLFVIIEHVRGSLFVDGWFRRHARQCRIVLERRVSGVLVLVTCLAPAVIFRHNAAGHDSASAGFLS